MFVLQDLSILVGIIVLTQRTRRQSASVRPIIYYKPKFSFGNLRWRAMIRKQGHPKEPRERFPEQHHQEDCGSSLQPLFLGRRK